MNGKGIEALRAAGIEVIVGVLEHEAAWQNRSFLHWIRSRTPRLTLKVATSIDLRVRMADTQTRYITSEESRREVHRLRSKLDAVMIGVGTAQFDNPELTVRLCEGRHPTRVIVDPTCRLPTSTALVSTARDVRTIVVCSERASLSHQQALSDRGVEVVPLPSREELILTSSDILQALASRNLASILVEGGPFLANRLLRDDCIQELILHVAPMMIGSGPMWFTDVNMRSWRITSISPVGTDVHAVYVRTP
jgi:diaminohydroxyphosphoribosylaminopyrimidine deaminase/5-amino-6-(5-phosphoribosylamino)uracil reductase